MLTHAPQQTLVENNLATPAAVDHQSYSSTREDAALIIGAPRPVQFTSHPLPSPLRHLRPRARNMQQTTQPTDRIQHARE
jgi:hypothetical protein